MDVEIDIRSFFILSTAIHTKDTGVECNRAIKIFMVKIGNIRDACCMSRWGGGRNEDVYESFGMVQQ